MTNVNSFLQEGDVVKHNTLAPFTVTNEFNNSGSIGETIGGFISSGRLLWRAKGPSIEIYDIQTKCNVAAWTFSAAQQNKTAKVTCACSIGVRNTTHVAIGVELENEKKLKGLIGILSLSRSQIVRAFHLPYKINSICMIKDGDKTVDPCTLANELRYCVGLLAAATENVGLYLIDLCLDQGDDVLCDEFFPATYSDIMLPDPNPEARRKETLAKRRFPFLYISSDTVNNENGMFLFMGPDDNILLKTTLNSVSITSLTYISQLAALVVGYSFGSFQIFNLSQMTIDCATPVEDDCPPVVSVSYQEPENDPRNFVYIWIARAYTKDYEVFDNTSAENCRFGLYAMNYEKKEWIEGHGLWYQTLQSMYPRFEFEAVGGFGIPSVKNPSIISNLSVDSAGLIVDCGASSALSTSDEESGPVPEQSLCFFCWKGSVLEYGRVVTNHYVAVFDINQWYQAQMPSRLFVDRTMKCSFMGFCILNDIPNAEDEFVISSCPKSWSRYRSRTLDDYDWYPSSLSYEFNILTNNNLVTFRCLSTQQKALVALRNEGPLSVVDPDKCHSLCASANIIPSVPRNGSKLPLVAQREDLLNVALNHHLLPFLNQCINEFSLGKFTHLGCSVNLLLEWCWNKVHEVKGLADSIYSPILSGDKVLTNHSLTTLHHYLTNLSHLSLMVCKIKEAAGDAVNINIDELDGRILVVNVLQLHLRVTLWFFQCGLLPETDDSIDDAQLSYPAQSLDKLYKERHSDLNKLSVNIKSNEVLLIENLCDSVGPMLSEVWEREQTGIYPPRSLQDLLSIYLIPGVDASIKHRIVQYLFLDIASLMSESCATHITEELVKFPSSFSLSPSLIKLTQAFWLIDHKDFQEGLSILLHPLVNYDDITPKQQRAIIKAFLYQGEENCALAFVKIRSVPSSILEDVQLCVTLFLACGKIDEAYSYQKVHRVKTNSDALLSHFFSGCEQLGLLKTVLSLPLTPYEEKAFIKYLKESDGQAAQDILLVHFIQQSRFGDLFGMEHNIGFRNNKNEKARRALIQGYMSHLPKLKNIAQDIARIKTGFRCEYSKPKPFSAQVRLMKTPKPFETSPKFTCPPVTPFRTKFERREEYIVRMGLAKHDRDEDNSIIYPDIRRTPIVTREENSYLFFGSPFPKEKDSFPSKSPSTPTVNNDVYKILHQVLIKSSAKESGIAQRSKKSKPCPMTEIASLIKTPSSIKSSKKFFSDSLVETPQSILKIRKAIQSPKSTNEKSPAQSVKRLPRLNFDKDDTLDNSHLTPKNIRFYLPLSERLSNRSPSDKQHSSPEISLSPSPRKPLHSYEHHVSISDRLKANEGFENDYDHDASFNESFHSLEDDSISGDAPTPKILPTEDTPEKEYEKSKFDFSIALKNVSNNTDQSVLMDASYSSSKNILSNAKVSSNKFDISEDISDPTQLVNASMTEVSQNIDDKTKSVAMDMSEVTEIVGDQTKLDPMDMADITKRVNNETKIRMLDMSGVTEKAADRTMIESIDMIDTTKQINNRTILEALDVIDTTEGLTKAVSTDMTGVIQEIDFDHKSMSGIEISKDENETIHKDASNGSYQRSDISFYNVTKLPINETKMELSKTVTENITVKTTISTRKEIDLDETNEFVGFESGIVKETTKLKSSPTKDNPINDILITSSFDEDETYDASKALSDEKISESHCELRFSDSDEEEKLPDISKDKQESPQIDYNNLVFKLDTTDEQIEVPAVVDNTVKPYDSNIKKNLVNMHKSSQPEKEFDYNELVLKFDKSDNNVQLPVSLSQTLPPDVHHNEKERLDQPLSSELDDADKYVLTFSDSDNSLDDVDSTTAKKASDNASKADNSCEIPEEVIKHEIKRAETLGDVIEKTKIPEKENITEVNAGEEANVSKILSTPKRQKNSESIKSNVTPTRRSTRKLTTPMRCSLTDTPSSKQKRKRENSTSPKQSPKSPEKKDKSPKEKEDVNKMEVDHSTPSKKRRRDSEDTTISTPLRRSARKAGTPVTVQSTPKRGRTPLKTHNASILNSIIEELNPSEKESNKEEPELATKESIIQPEPSIEGSLREETKPSIEKKRNSPSPKKSPARSVKISPKRKIGKEATPEPSTPNRRRRASADQLTPLRRSSRAIKTNLSSTQNPHDESFDMEVENLVSTPLPSPATTPTRRLKKSIAPKLSDSILQTIEENAELNTATPVKIPSPKAFSLFRNSPAITFEDARRKLSLSTEDLSKISPMRHTSRRRRSASDDVSSADVNVSENAPDETTKVDTKGISTMTETKFIKSEGKKRLPRRTIEALSIIQNMDISVEMPSRPTRSRKSRIASDSIIEINKSENKQKNADNTEVNDQIVPDTYLNEAIEESINSTEVSSKSQRGVKYNFVEVPEDLATEKEELKKRKSNSVPRKMGFERLSLLKLNKVESDSDSPLVVAEKNSKKKRKRNVKAKCAEAKSSAPAKEEISTSETTSKQNVSKSPEKRTLRKTRSAQKPKKK